MDSLICQAPFLNSLKFFQKSGKPEKRAPLLRQEMLQQRTNTADGNANHQRHSAAGQQFVPKHPCKPGFHRTFFRLFTLSLFSHTAPPFHHSLKSRLLSAPIYDAGICFVRLRPVNPYNNGGRHGIPLCLPHCPTVPDATAPPTQEVPHGRRLRPYRPVPAALPSVPLPSGRHSGGGNC